MVQDAHPQYLTAWDIFAQAEKNVEVFHTAIEAPVSAGRGYCIHTAKASHVTVLH